MIEKTLNLIFIGDKFYTESGSMMSSLYTKDWKRSDWGFVSIALKSGNKVTIRPATDKELVNACKMLDKIKSERVKEHNHD